MGGNFSRAQEKHICELREITKTNFFIFNKKGLPTPPLSKASIKDLLSYIWANCPSYPEAGSVKPDTWRKIGKCLHASPRAPSPILASWRVIMEALSAQEQPLLKSLMEPPPYVNSNVKLVTPASPDVLTAPNAPNAPISNETKLSTNSEPISQTLYPCLNVSSLPPMGTVQSSINEAFKKGELDGTELSAFPLTFTQGAGGGVNPRWEPIPIKLIKDIKEAVQLYGIQAPYTKGLCRVLANAHVLIPYDWYTLFHMVLNGSQFVVWQSEFARAAAGLVIRNPGSNIEQICGTGAFADPTAQYQLGLANYNLTSQAALDALARVDDAGTNKQSFAKILQGASEPYADFVERLQVAVSRQITHVEAQNEILMKLAYENANADCKNLLSSLVNAPNVTLAQYINACRMVGTHAYSSEMMAAAIQKGNKPTGNCFNCGKPGHFKAQCHAPGGGASKLANSKESKPKTICPKCKKGFHWANQCRVKLADSGN